MAPPLPDSKKAKKAGYRGASGPPQHARGVGVRFPSAGSMYVCLFLCHSLSQCKWARRSKRRCLVFFLAAPLWKNASPNAHESRESVEHMFELAAVDTVEAMEDAVQVRSIPPSSPTFWSPRRFARRSRRRCLQTLPVIT